ncbi:MULTISPECIES: hypothetical protein [unclassified Rhizobium]|uniref:hypothetical protein n=1 Tax=unclassified Rhizobium TaxID=2613769 RepID=UPI001622F29B|nr:MULTISPECIES: hypothetical protein [unclassified Rhizobium]MBB3386004.1 hypothetical protein [Rhizobium sp. BK098]MBB3617819.1 hypothetical protein [Rhizobium sp. BK609]MBB3683366.1 hypothetical protein [Rhizobium sp. BK612]
MTQYRFKPYPYSAFRFTYPADHSVFPDWLLEAARADQLSLREDGKYQLNQLDHSFTIVDDGEWIVCSEDCEIVVMSDDSFQKTFEPIPA